MIGVFGEGCGETLFAKRVSPQKSFQRRQNGGAAISDSGGALVQRGS